MKLNFNLLKQIEYPQVILCRRSHQKIGELAGVTDLRLDLNLSSWDELSFSVPYRCQGHVHPLWDRICDLATVFLPQFGYFLIQVSEQDDGFNKTKRVTGKSLEIELGQILLHGVQINAVDGDIKDEDFAPKKFYQPLDQEHSILHLLLKEAPHWDIGHVDESLVDKQRSFDIDGTSIYDELMGEISEQFHCVFQFDSFRRLIHVYDQDTFGAETTLFLSHDNFIDSFTIEANAEEIKNCFKVSGGSGIEIREVNPNGTAYIYAWGSHDLADMTPELRERLAAYDRLYDSQREPYEALMLQIGKKIEELLALSSEAPADLTSEDWSRYSLKYLEEKRKIHQNALDVAIQKGCGSVTDPNYSTLYLPTYQRLVAIEAELKVRQSQIEARRAEYHALLAQKQTIQQNLDLERFLGTTLWKELSSYRREQTYDNSNYEVTDDMSDIERFALERQLYEQAYEEIQKINDPIYQFSTKMANLYAIFQAQESLVDQFQLGNFIRVGNREDEVHKVRFLKASICFEKPEDITVEFGEQMELQDNAAAANRFMDSVRQAASSYNFIRKQFEQDKDAMNYVKAVRLSGLSSALADVHNADNQEFTIGSRGLIGKEWNEEKGDYEPEQLHAIHNKLVFTDDSWKSCKLALGKIQINGADVYGLIGDVLIGKVVIGETLYIGNSQNTMVFDKTGFRITNGVNTVTIQPDTDHVFQILKGNTPVMFADANGNLTLTSRIITDSGYIGGWTIDKDGLRGNGVISGGQITSSNITGGTIDGAVITSNGESSSTSIRGGSITSVYGSSLTYISGGNILQSGKEVTFRNNSEYSVWEDGSQSLERSEIHIKHGTILMQSTYNAYLRAAIGNRNYYKLIGLSINGNIVIGQKAGTNGYVGSESPLSTGSLETKPVIMYCTTFRVNRDGAFYTNLDSGNTNLIQTRHLTASTGNGSNGEYLNIGGKSIPTGDWVASYVSGRLASIQSQIDGLQSQISALASRPVTPAPSA
ncbi:MAG: phage tail protein [Lachnospiraceae bacterium]|nr:phage tail protein [Lachnospiraceae bacterium]